MTRLRFAVLALIAAAALAAFGAVLVALRSRDPFGIAMAETPRSVSMSDSHHWDAVYRTKSPDQVSWYRPHLERSRAFLEAASLGPAAGIIDVGGGASSFVDDALDLGYSNVTVLDLSETALQAARARLGERANFGQMDLRGRDEGSFAGSRI